MSPTALIITLRTNQHAEIVPEFYRKLQWFNNAYATNVKE